MGKHPAVTLACPKIEADITPPSLVLMCVELVQWALTFVIVLSYKCITRSYKGCYQKIAKPMSVSLSYCNSSMLFQSCANYKPLTALKTDRKLNEVFIMLLILLPGYFLLKNSWGRTI